MKTKLLLIVLLLGSQLLYAQDEREDMEDADQVEEMEKEKKRRYRPRVKTRWGIVDLGVSVMDINSTVPVGPGVDPLETRLWKCTNLNIHFIQQRISIVRGAVNLHYGLTLETHKYYFDNPVILLEDTPEVAFEFVENARFNKTRLNYTYASIPLMLNIKSNPRYPYRSLHISAGVYGGLLLGANHKIKNGGKVKVKDNFGLNQWRYGFRGEIGYGPLIFYGTVGLNGLFEDDKDGGYDVNPFSIGLVLWPF